MSIGEHRVATVLVEEQVPIAHEMYAAVLNDPASKGPLLLFSAQGGMDIEEIAEQHPDALLRLPDRYPQRPRYQGRWSAH